MCSVSISPRFPEASRVPPTRPQTVFVLELVSSGYFGETIGPSFRAEGRAMLDAVLDDLRRIPEIAATTILDGDPATLLTSVARSAADATLIIAPEFDGLLERFCDAARRTGATSLNCEQEALSLCGDKWRFFRHLAEHGLATPPTTSIQVAAGPAHFPCVVKPRFGAGSWLVRQVMAPAAWPDVAEAYRQAGLSEALCQPIVRGSACSVGALIRSGRAPELLPIAEQRLSRDGEFRYLGGTMPANLPAERVRMVRERFSRLLAATPGLHGYVGCDVIVPEVGEPQFVELNPRLTTSYVGYRALAEDNLMERLLFPDRVGALRWKAGPATFAADGSVAVSPPA